MKNRKINHTIGTNIGRRHPRTQCDRRHAHITTMNVGELIPVLVDPIYPGDMIKLQTNAIIRQLTLQTPVMDNTYIDVGVFFVPTWQIWDDFFTFYGENKDPYAVKVKPQIPQLTAPDGGWDYLTIADYLKWPVKKTGVKVSALKPRAIAKVINDYYKNQNLQSDCHINLTSTPTEGSNGSDYVVDIEKAGKPFIANKMADYFTTAQPAPQKGDDTLLSIAGNAEVHTSPNRFDVASDFGLTVEPNMSGASPYNIYVGGNTSTGSKSSPIVSDAEPTTAPSSVNVVRPDNLYANLETASSITINKLRDKFTEQQIKEIDLIYGTRYYEYLFGHWDVSVDMTKINKSEFLGGSHEPVGVHQIPQTSGTTDSSPLGNLGAIGQLQFQSRQIRKSFDQHGYLVVLATVRYNHTYQDGIPIEDLYVNKEDFFDPVYNHIGNQPIYNKEIYFQGNQQDDEIFGWKEAWQEAREMQNRVTGLMRYDLADKSLTIGQYWNYADKYDKLPTLSNDWIREDSDNVKRTLAIQSQTDENANAQFYGQFYFNYLVERQIATYSTPGLKKL